MKVEEVKCPGCTQAGHLAVLRSGPVDYILFICCSCNSWWEISAEEFEKSSVEDVAGKQRYLQHCPKCCHLGGCANPICDGLDGAEVFCGKCGFKWYSPP